MVHIIHNVKLGPLKLLYQSNLSTKSTPAQDLFIDLGSQCHERCLGVGAAAELNAALASEGHGAVVKAS